MNKSLLLITVIVCLWPVSAMADPVEDVSKALEQKQMSWLSEQQSNPAVVIDQFKTDGCSGGMSDIWNYLAELSPEFTEWAGKQPPWESCCVTHDKHYWKGDSDNGYAKRLEADKQLRQCVRRAGRMQSDVMASKLELTAEEFIQLIDTTADLMYKAVRIGGKPCTGLPWRWGHGWPACDIGLPVTLD